MAYAAGILTADAVAILGDGNSLVTSNVSEEQRQLYREKCRASLYFLCKGVLGFRDFTPSLHLTAANFIQQQSAKRKLFMLPRSFFKSYLATIGYPIWLTIQEPDDKAGFRGTDERILIANATATNSEHFLAKIKSIFERNATFQWLFPECVPDFNSQKLTWNTTEATLPRRNDYPEPTYSAVGSGAAPGRAPAAAAGGSPALRARGGAGAGAGPGRGGGRRGDCPGAGRGGAGHGAGLRPGSGAAGAGTRIRSGAVH